MTKITANGWPWQQVNQHWASNLDKTTGQKWGWNPFAIKGMGRFGGGWAFKFGVTVNQSLSDWVIDLGLGSIRITRKRNTKGGA
jgi:hypothetical protein